MRRVERALLGEYRALVEQALAGLSPDDLRARRRRSRALPDMIRGYEDIKLGNVEKFRSEVRALGV